MHTPKPWPAPARGRMNCWRAALRWTLAGSLALTLAACQTAPLAPAVVQVQCPRVPAPPPALMAAPLPDLIGQAETLLFGSPPKVPGLSTR